MTGLSKFKITNDSRILSLFKKRLSVKSTKAFIGKLVIYVILIDLAFVFIYPFVFMFLTSIKLPGDLYYAAIKRLPRHLTFSNFTTALRIMDYPLHFVNSVITTLLPTLGHVMSASFIGYGFARFKFRGREFLFTLVLVTLIVPPQTIIIPLYELYYKLSWTDTFAPLIVPAFFGTGLKGALYIFIFRQLFRGLPTDLENAAKLDGCGVFKTYVKIALPLSKSAILVTSILSIVWHWNDFFEPQVYLVTPSKFTLPMLLPGLWRQFDQVVGGAVENLSITVPMACSILILLPMIILYAVLQKGFMQGIERSGLVG